jgi:organic radical activating enzyme
MSSYRGVSRPSAGQLLVCEVFGPTLQGEGPSAGRAAVFLRLGMCNLACKWCDSGYTWDHARFNLLEELSVVGLGDVAANVLSRAAPLVVVTGGEPLLQRKPLLPLVRALSAAGRRVEFETSGTVAPGGLVDVVDRFVVSPKLAHSGQGERARLRWSVLEELAALESTEFKFVARTADDLVEVEAIAARLGLSAERVWVMPEGVTSEQVTAGMRILAPEVYRRGWSLSGRTHILLWGDERGR